MNKIKKMLAAFTAVILLLAAAGIAAAEQEARKVETPADADEFIAAFLGEHPEQMEGVWAFSVQMKAAAKLMGGIPGLAGQLAALGTVERIYPAVEGTLQGYKTFNIPCVFSLQPADVILVVQNGAVAGLQIGAFSGQQEEPASEAFESIDLALPVPSLGELPGILTVPKGEGPFPAVVLIHGSGTSDRDETAGSLKPFRDIAEGLAEKGIAVYRFDKRTYVYGGQLMDDRQFTLMDESVEDAVNAVQMLAEQDRIDPGRIFVLGHSLGGSAVPAVARELQRMPEKACGFIMMAASPRQLDVLVREQYEFLYSLLPEITEEQQAEKDAVFTDLDRLNDPDSLTDDDVVMGAYAPYWKWLKAYDILQAAEEITEPVLLLQGEEDYQVTMQDFGIWKDAVGEKENWRLISYPGLTHPFASGQKTEGAAVYSRAGRMDAQVIQDIADFVMQAGDAL